MRHLISGTCPPKRCMMKTGTTTASGTVGTGRGGRMSRQRKRDAVLRLLRGEDLETVSSSLGVHDASLTTWRDWFLAAGEAALTSQPTDGETLESERLKARLGDMLLQHELLEQQITKQERRRPFGRGRKTCAGRPARGGRADSPSTTPIKMPPKRCAQAWWRRRSVHRPQ